jgi:hypothetical protein
MGKEFTVNSCSNNSYGNIYRSNETSMGFYENELELAPKFKVGQEVRITKYHISDFQNSCVGNVFVIKEEPRVEGDIIWYESQHGVYGWRWKEEQLVLVSEKENKQQYVFTCDEYFEIGTKDEIETHLKENCNDGTYEIYELGQKYTVELHQEVTWKEEQE